MDKLEILKNIRTEHSENRELGKLTRVVYDCPMCGAKQIASVKGENPLAIWDIQEEVEERAMEHHERKHSKEEDEQLFDVGRAAQGEAGPKFLRKVRKALRSMWALLGALPGMGKGNK